MEESMKKAFAICFLAAAMICVASQAEEGNPEGDDTPGELDPLNPDGENVKPGRVQTEAGLICYDKSACVLPNMPTCVQLARRRDTIDRAKSGVGAPYLWLPKY